VDGVPMAVQYRDAQCTQPYYNYDLSGCFVSDTDHPTDEMWAGGVFRENTIVVMIGGLSNSLGSSTFHDIYMPIPGTYNTPDMQLDFTEAQLEGSGLLFMPSNKEEEEDGDDDAANLYSNMFVAQWGRSCLNPSSSSSSPPCYEISDDIMFPNSTFYMLVRHYLDPQTGTGPHKDALPRHRVLVFDKL
jgi:hypothetical protein